jgi:hypothetical protein
MTHREYVDLRNKIKNIKDDASAKDAFEQLFKLLDNLKKIQIDYDAILEHWNKIMDNTEIKTHFKPESEEIKIILESILNKEYDQISSFKSKYDEFFKKYKLWMKSNKTRNTELLNDRITFINALINV